MKGIKEYVVKHEELYSNFCDTVYTIMATDTDGALRLVGDCLPAFLSPQEMNRVFRSASGDILESLVRDIQDTEGPYVIIVTKDGKIWTIISSIDIQ